MLSCMFIIPVHQDPAVTVSVVDERWYCFSLPMQPHSRWHKVYKYFMSRSGVRLYLKHIDQTVAVERRGWKRAWGEASCAICDDEQMSRSL